MPTSLGINSCPKLKTGPGFFYARQGPGEQGFCQNWAQIKLHLVHPLSLVKPPMPRALLYM